LTATSRLRESGDKSPHSKSAPSSWLGWTASLLCWIAIPSALASDWPQFLGPTRDAVYAGPPLSEDWGKEGPRVVWKKDVGEGYS
jgi:hypothetical protein